MFKILLVIYIFGVVVVTIGRYIWPTVQDSTRSALVDIFLWPVTFFRKKK